MFNGVLTKGSSVQESETTIQEPPKISVDARLPNPTILTCNEPIPLRLLIQHLNDRTEPIYVQSLQIELIAYTRLRAEDCIKTNSSSWIITSISDMGVKLGNNAESAGTEMAIDNKYWKNRPLPNTVCPSFETCNIGRYYELETRIGIGYGSPKSSKVWNVICVHPFGLPNFQTLRRFQGQLVVIPLRLPVKVYSGIAPSPSLLAAMAAAAQAPPVLPPRPGRLFVPVSSSAQSAPNSPSSAAPVQVSTEGPSASSIPGNYEDAPPTYEDAIAEEIPPIYGHRREYIAPSDPEGSTISANDGKRRSVN